MEIKQDKVNLGSGRDITPEYFNIDRTGVLGADLVMDLNNMPWTQLPDNYFMEVKAFDIIEHIDDPLKFVEECYRILKVNGILKIHTSNWKYPNAYRDITHKRPFDIDTFDLFDMDTQYGKDYGEFYTFARFKILIKREEGQELYFEMQKI